MTRITPRDRSEIPELEPHFGGLEERMGFLPTSMLVMAHKPDLVRAFARLGEMIYDSNARVSRGLRYLVGHVASRAAGCMYCSAHTASNASRFGVTDEKLAAVWDFETSPLFDEAERAALRFAQNAAVVPNAVRDKDVAELSRHYDTEEMIEILAVIGWFGFLNRWNDTLATTLEDTPRAVAERTIADSGWEAGKHG